MQVDPNRAAGTSQYQGRTFYFCSTACKQKFDENPQRYVAQV
jgi:Cu+-exporting ATPase